MISRIKKFKDFLREAEEGGSGSKDSGVFSFDELSVESKNRAIEKFRNESFDLEYDWSDSVEDHFKEEVEKKFGFVIEKIELEGSFDGYLYCVFSGDVESGEKKLFFKNALGITENTKFIDLGNEPGLIGDLAELGFDSVEKIEAEELGITIKIIRPYRNLLMEAIIDVGYTPDWMDEEKADEELAEHLYSLEEKIKDWAENLSADLAKELRKEYEYLISDETIEEIFLANEYSFDSEGNLIS